MEVVFLDDIITMVSNEEVLKALKTETEDEYASEILELLEKAKKVAKPKALYGTAYIEDRGENWIEIEGVRFTSKILSINLKNVHKVFPYVVTCGQELYNWTKSISDPIVRYWADTLCEIFLRKAFIAMNHDFITKIKPGKTATMNPGSLEDWPISEQRQLFTLLGNENMEAAGIELTESFLMLPVKSISGMKFQTEHNFENCMLCPRERCPGRRAEYAPNNFQMD